jgi:hypothetical protein
MKTAAKPVSSANLWFLQGPATFERSVNSTFLRSLADQFPRPPLPPPTYSRTLVLGWAGILQLVRWEMEGIWLHLETGLPSSREAFLPIHDWCTNLSEADRDQRVRGFFDRIVNLRTKRFAHESLHFLGTDVVVSALDDDSFVEAMARFLWIKHTEGRRK